MGRDLEHSLRFHGVAIVRERRVRAEADCSLGQVGLEGPKGRVIG